MWTWCISTQCHNLITWTLFAASLAVRCISGVIIQLRIVLTWLSRQLSTNACSVFSAELISRTHDTSAHWAFYTESPIDRLVACFTAGSVTSERYSIRRVYTTRMWFVQVTVRWRGIDVLTHIGTNARDYTTPMSSVKFYHAHKITYTDK